MHLERVEVKPGLGRRDYVDHGIRIVIHSQMAYISFRLTPEEATIARRKGAKALLAGIEEGVSWAKRPRDFNKVLMLVVEEYSLHDGNPRVLAIRLLDALRHNLNS